MRERQSFIAEAIIEYLRGEEATASSNGVETSASRIANTLSLSIENVARHLRKLIDLEIVVLKYGIYKQGNTKPKSFALAEGYEQGDGWKKVYYGEKPSSQYPANGSPAPRNIAKLAKLGNDKNLIEQLLQATKITTELQQKVVELQKKVLDVQSERNKAYEKLREFESSIKELEEDSKLNSESAKRNQQEIVNLELQLRQAMSKANQYDRQIAKNDERARAFAHR